HEPINIRAENVQRIAEHARRLGTSVNTAVFSSRETWREYAVGSLRTVVRVARDVGLSERLHLWPDKALGTKQAVAARKDPDRYSRWLQRCWRKVSDWPKEAA